ncbi:MAG: hypothetical protein HY423_06045 [Candidatus Lambdaproteobacteria bacterium]|nr:hypothetical protein [Candidatus Lambdaproteobacteria bacterium]
MARALTVAPCRPQVRPARHDPRSAPRSARHLAATRLAALPRGLLLAALLFPALLLPDPCGATELEFLPGEAWALRLSVSREVQEEAYDRGGQHGPLKQYLIPGRENHEQVQGEISRTYSRTDIHLQYGLTDRWNLMLDVPYTRVRQSSSLTTAATDAALRDRVARLGPRDVSGLGNPRLTSLHRPVFSDWHAFAWGYALTLPAQAPLTPYDGVGTLDVRSPLVDPALVLHYTYFPQGVLRGRLDLAGSAIYGLEAQVDTPAGNRQTLDPGNAVDATLGWTQELGRILLAGEFEQYSRLANRLDKEFQGDPVRELLFRARLGYGNLIELETARIGFPYQVQLALERTILAFNRPLRSIVTVSLLTYF